MNSPNTLTLPAARHDSLPQTGLIKFFKNGKGKGGGFGFIARGGLPDLFIHVSEIRGSSASERTLYPGDHVTYQIGVGKDGRDRAENVRVQSRAQQDAPIHRHD